MEIIDKDDAVREALENCAGCVVYGAGLVATCIIQYLIKEKLSSKVICIAVKNKEKNPETIMGIQVCTLSELSDYREKYLFVIATLEHMQKKIKMELEDFGCRRVVGISDTYYAGIREKMNDFTPDILCAVQKGFLNIYDNFILLDKKLDNKMEKLGEELTYLIEEQNEVSEVNTKAFAKYRNCYRGRDVVIAATGPTLNVYTPIENAIHIGVNAAYRKPHIKLDYLFVQDGRPAYLKQGKYEGIESVKCKIFMGRVLKRSPFEFSEFPEEYRLSGNVTDYFISHSWPQENIYKNICHHPVSGGVTVTFSALHFALYTYPKKIYLVGCDTTPALHFDGTVDRESPLDECAVKTIKERYKLTKEFAQMHYPETEIISVNPVGLKGIFKDIYTE